MPIIRKAQEPEPEVEPVFGAFLDLLERDIRDHPERLQPLTASFVDRIRKVTEGADVDPYGRIEGPVAI